MLEFACVNWKTGMLKSSWFPNRDSNKIPAEYVSWTLPLEQSVPMYQPNLLPSPDGGRMIPPECWCTCTRLCGVTSRVKVIFNRNFQSGWMSKNKDDLFVWSNFYLLSLSCGFRLKESTWCSDRCPWVHWPKWQRLLVLVLHSHQWIVPHPPRWQLTHYLKPIASRTSSPPFQHTHTVTSIL